MPELNNAKFAFDNAIKLLNDNNLKESVEQLNEIIKIQPNHIKSLNLLGDIYIKLNKPKESLHFVNKVLNIEKFNKFNPKDASRAAISGILMELRSGAALDPKMWPKSSQDEALKVAK